MIMPAVNTPKMMGGSASFSLMRKAEAANIASQIPVSTHDPMAWDKQQSWVAPGCTANRLRGHFGKASLRCTILAVVNGETFFKDIFFAF